MPRKQVIVVLKTRYMIEADKPELFESAMKELQRGYFLHGGASSIGYSVTRIDEGALAEIVPDTP